MRRNGGRGGYGDKFLDLRVEDSADPIAELKRLLKLHRVYYLVHEAESRFTQGDLDGAISSAKGALRINPDSDDAYIDLALIYLRLGRTGESAKVFKEALNIKPRTANVIR